MNLKNKIFTYFSLFDKPDFTPNNLLGIRDNVLFSFAHWQETNSFSSFTNLISELGYLNKFDPDTILNMELENISLEESLMELILNLTSLCPVESKIIASSNIFMALLIRSILS
ncbi:MAG: hypothetical protein ACRCU6_03015 [Fusobacteriaceae bacterium]